MPLEARTAEKNAAPMRTSKVDTNGINLHVAEAGPKDGPLVVLLHGFPEFWYGWRKQIDHLAARGYFVVAPDQRGYDRSDKPGPVSAYGIDVLAKDITGLIDAYGREKAIVVGHDWGAAVAWWLGNRYPERVEKLVAINVPHHAVMQRTLRTSFAQLRKSWYIFFFQLPILPEMALTQFRCRLPTRALVATSRPGTFTTNELERYREAWLQPGALKSMVNWYRAALRVKPPRAKSPRIKVPTLLIWGTRDKFLGREMAQPSIDLCDDGRLEFIEGASHWVQHEEPARVNSLLSEFFSSARPQ